ncbi:hypothetical protein DRJ22_05435 [Candidatus Woesearchaeota archaeon]|nr:MAG: hypothetical protein DRJ22_05435 [Candidatus Woesearchaeota archaeon]
MPEKAIIDYIKKSIATGYSPEQIRNTLITAGYSPHEVDVLIRSAIYKRKSPKKLIWIAAILIAITLTVIGLLLLVSQKEEPPNIKLTAIQTQIPKGQALLLKTQIINPTETTTQARLEYMILAPNGPKLMSKKKIVTISNYLTEIPEQLTPNIPPGKYTLKLTTKIGQYTLTKEIYFEITAAATHEKPTIITTPTNQRMKKSESQKECIGGCDDYNACTTDWCEEGKCEHEPIIPCCGNKICEQEENEDNCPIDCKKKKTIPKHNKKIQKTADLAVMDCERIATVTEKDKCFENAAKEYLISNICSKISQETTRDSCYMNFALNYEDFTVCKKISNKWTKRSCESLAKMSAMSET